MASLILKIDDLTRKDHHYLDEADVCYYAGEYTAGKGHAHSETNQLILNFKKAMDKKGTHEWQYKEIAIQKVANIFRSAIKPTANVTFVPMPPSKSANDPMHDDRMLRLLQAFCAGHQADIRELICQKISATPSHQSNFRPTPDELAANYCINEKVTQPKPTLIFIVDDVLTTGCHFKAAKKILASKFPDTPIKGLFIARRAIKSVDIDFDVLD